ncbi:MAG TPA: VOC family protein [Gemmatimonadaceae bacterium]|jgi:hypothetical protein
MPVLAPIDHLVYATADLESGMRAVEELTGIAPTRGGQHPGRGTRNALVALGDDVYLEIVAPDPAQDAPPAGRWLGVDAVSDARLTTWAAKGSGLTELRRSALEHAVPLGEVKSSGRRRADGVLLSWQLTEPEPLVADGVIPFFIDWGESPHPARTAAQGVSLIEFRIEHPHVDAIKQMLAALGLDVEVVHAEQPGLVAVIQGRNGVVELR